MGSAVVFLLVLSTSSFKPQVRQIFSCAAAGYFLSTQSFNVLPFVLGALFADWSIGLGSQKNVKLGLDSTSEPTYKTIGILLLKLSATASALLLGSFPEQPDTVEWAKKMNLSFSQQFSINDYMQIQKLCCATSAAIIMIIILTTPSAQWILSKKPLQFLGKISFSLYLVHLSFLLFVGCNLYLFLLSLGLSPLVSWALIHPVWLSLSILVAMLMTRYVDQPALRLGRMLEERWAASYAHQK